jgi:hypothetical protein
MQYFIKLGLFLCILGSLFQAYAQPNKVQIKQTQINDPADGVDGQFGYAVAISGNLVAVGAPQTTRGVRQVAEITDPENGFDDQFGYSVAMSGGTLVVGAPQYAGPTGAAYIFVGSGANWKQAAMLTSGDSKTVLFGTSAAIGGNVVVVGTPDDQNGSANGVVFVFVKPAGGWRGELTPTATLTLPAVVNNLLGKSVAISPDGKTIVAGVPGLNDDTGGTCVFVEPEGGWTNMTEATATLTAPSSAVLGSSVALGGDTIVAGENNLGDNPAAFVFVEPTGGWSSTNQPNATLTASDGSFEDNFGYSVALSGHTVVVGSPYQNKAGAAYVYVEPETGWQDMTQTAELGLATDFGFELGYAVGIENNIVLAGAPLVAIGHNSDQGAVFGYVEPAKGWQSTTSPNASVTAQSGVADERFGSALAISGNTFVVGAPYYNGLIGAVYIFAAQ